MPWGKWDAGEDHGGNVAETGGLEENRQRQRSVIGRGPKLISRQQARRKRGKGFNRLWVTDEMLQGRNGWQTGGRRCQRQEGGDGVGRWIWNEGDNEFVLGMISWRNRRITEAKV